MASNAAGGYQAGMGVACGDLDGDGRPDLMVTNFYGEGTTLYQNLGRGLFADRSAASRHRARHAVPPRLRHRLRRRQQRRPARRHDRQRPRQRAPADLSLPHALRLYEGRPDGRFVDVSDQAGPPWNVPRVGRGLAAGDLDNDGRCDAVIVAQDGPLAYFHNRTRRAGHFVTLRLEGTRSNRDGVGARVTVTAGGRRQVAQRIGGGSYMSADDPRLHFGLGPNDRVEQVEVRWPSGRTDRWTSLPAGTGYSLREGDPAPRPLAGFARRDAN